LEDFVDRVLVQDMLDIVVSFNSILTTKTYPAVTVAGDRANEPIGIQEMAQRVAAAGLKGCSEEENARAKRLDARAETSADRLRRATPYDQGDRDGRKRQPGNGLTASGGGEIIGTKQ
jgi:hypothetical protein